MPCVTIHDEDGKAVGFAHIRVQKRWCQFCRVREVTRLCDFPVGTDKTCDKGICDACTTNVASAIETGFCGVERDYCPDHKDVKPSQRYLFEEAH